MVFTEEFGQIIGTYFGGKVSRGAGEWVRRGERDARAIGFPTPHFGPDIERTRSSADAAFLRQHSNLTLV